MSVGVAVAAPPDQADVCGPCHPDADCYNSFTGVRPGRILVDVATYSNPEVVFRLAEEMSWSADKAQAVFDEMLQYLAQGAVAPTNSAKSPTKDVDAAWHTFLLFTRDYAAFCRKHLGFFVHHVPTPRLGGRVGTTTCDMK